MAARKLCHVFFLCGAVFTAGCSSTYWVNRQRDALDIFTVSIGVGGGAKARVGPIQPGLFFNSDYAGVRSGMAFVTNSLFSRNVEVVSPFPFPTGSDKVGDWVTSLDSFKPEQGQSPRGKEYDAVGLWAPVVAYTNKAHYYTQIEVAAGAGGTLRVGVNVGELLDFLLGWTTLDLFGDDIEKDK